MMSNPSQRWLDPTVIAGHVSYMVSDCLQACRAVSPTTQNDRRKNQLRNTIVATLGAAVALAVLIGVLVAFAEPVPGKEPDYPAVILVCLAVVGGAGALTYAASGVNNQKRQQRDNAVRAFCERAAGFKFAGRTEFEAYHVGKIPWFTSEEWIHTFGLMVAELPAYSICMVECHQVIDPVLTTTDSKLVQGASHFISNRHQRLYRREMEAVVFSKQLDVPDLVIVPQRDANRAYYKRALQGQPCEVAEHYALPNSLRKKYWVASANPDAAVQVLDEELLGLLAARDWCIVQIIGGHCAVMTAQWHGNRPAAAPRQVEAVANNVDFALRVFGCLNRRRLDAVDAEPTEAGGELTSTSLESGSGGVATLAAPAHMQEDSRIAMAGTPPSTSPFQKKSANRRQKHSLLKRLVLMALGIPLMLIGGLTTIGATVELDRGDASLTWPHVKGLVTRSAINTETRDRDGQQLYLPNIEYKYAVEGTIFTNDDITMGELNPSEKQEDVQQIVARYPLRDVVTVCYQSDDPQVAVLKPGVENRSLTTWVRNVSLGMLACGFLMSVYGAVGRKRPKSSLRQSGTADSEDES